MHITFILLLRNVTVNPTTKKDYKEAHPSRTIKTCLWFSGTPIIRDAAFVHLLTSGICQVKN